MPPTFSVYLSASAPLNELSKSTRGITESFLARYPRYESKRNFAKLSSMTHLKLRIAGFKSRSVKVMVITRWGVRKLGTPNILYCSTEFD